MRAAARLTGNAAVPKRESAAMGSPSAYGLRVRRCR